MDNPRLRDFVDFAIEREIESADFYERHAGRTNMAAQKKLFSDLAVVERGHEQKLRTFRKTGKADAFLGGRSPNLKIADFLVAVELKPDSPLQDILIFAAKKEQKAYELYSRLAGLETDQTVEVFFRELAEAEKGHKYELEKEYEKFVMAEN